MFDVFTLQKQLVETASPSGFETDTAKLLAQLAAPFVDEIRIDALGSVICHKKGEGKKVMYCAHQDAIGFLARHIDEQGAVHFASLGGFDTPDLISARVRFKNGTHGIIGARDLPKAMQKSAQALGITDLYIDIGASTREQALEYVKIGDLAVFEGGSRLVGGNNIMGPYADDLIGCVVLLMVMEKLKDAPCVNDMYYVFASQEEVGCKGSQTAAFAIDPDYGIAVDIGSEDSAPGREKTPGNVVLGHGPTVKYKDMGAISSEHYNGLLRAVAKNEGIAYQDEIMMFGATDAEAIQLTRAGTHATCISIPTRYGHAETALFNIGDVEDAARLMAAAAQAEL